MGRLLSLSDREDWRCKQCLVNHFFFFSSRRRHTRLQGDWSSDVCSSDLRSAHVGFLVDAAILGFAVGTGFAVVENVYYASVMRDLELGLWLVRGLGTAVMEIGRGAGRGKGEISGGARSFKKKKKKRSAQQ